MINLNEGDLQMKTNAKKLILGASLVGAMAMVSGCSSMGMCGGSKCGNKAKADKSSKCGGDNGAAKKCGSGKCGSK